MRLCAIDTETTGLNKEKDLITEIGYVIWDTQVHKPYVLKSALVQIPKDTVITDAVSKLTHITRGHVDSGVTIELALAELQDDLDYWDVSYLVAHNAQYDKGMLEAAGFESGLHWVCTKDDIEYGIEFSNKNLTYVAATLGFVNPFPHMALFDAVTTKKVLDHFDVMDVINSSKAEKIKFYLKDPMKPWEDPKPDGEKDVDRGKSIGFRWDASAKVWWASVLTNKLKEFQDKAAELNLEVYSEDLQ